MEYLKSIAFIAQALQEDAAGTGRAGPPPPNPPMPAPPSPAAVLSAGPWGRRAWCPPLRDPNTLPVPTDGGEGVTPDTPKMLKLAEQCLERVKSIAAALGEPAVAFWGAGSPPGAQAGIWG